MTAGAREAQGAPHVLEAWLAGELANRVLHVEREPARVGHEVPWPSWADAAVIAAFEARGARRPWRHQIEAAEALHDARHVWIGTGTASGKSLAYLLPVLTALREGHNSRAVDATSVSPVRTGSLRTATALYLAPTKALAADQFGSVHRLGLPGIHASTIDGDSSFEGRRWAREHANLVLTNPDLLHHTLLPGHRHWARFLRRLQFVIVDEGHAYRGVFGTHVALILRRLRRLARYYGADPCFVVASATSATPADTARRLLGLDVLVVDADDSPRGARNVVFWEPPREPGPQASRRSGVVEAADLVADLAANGAQTLAFVPSRRGTETLARLTRARLQSAAPELVSRVAAYRGGYLPEERRALEEQLRARELMAVAATNALELGIDIAGLDAVVVCGWPGRRASFRQQIGRAGRRGTEALAVLVATDDPLDQYVIHHPEAVFGADLEQTRFDPENPYVLGPHLAAAASELPLTLEDLPLFGESAHQLADQLAAAGWLRRRAGGWFWTRPDRAGDLADLRGTGGSPVRIVEQQTGRVLGTIDPGSAHAGVHPGAVYVHQGEPWLVESLDLEAHVALVRRADGSVTTHAQSLSDVRVLGVRRQRSFQGRHAPLTLSLGPVEVTTHVVGYLVREATTGRVLGREALELPRQTLRTSGVWWTIPPQEVESFVDPSRLAGALHAAEHASIALLPLLATCDRWDIGGLSTISHTDTGTATVFVHDAQPGGSGFAERGYEVAQDWLRATLTLISECACSAGCPACVQSPKCGNGNEPLDKLGAVEVLEAVLHALDNPIAQASGPLIGRAIALEASSPAPSSESES